MVLEVERQDSVAVVTLSAEAARNAFDSDSMSEISATLNDLMDDSEIRGIVLTGTGRFFCAGADIEEFQRSIDEGIIGPLVDNLTSILHPLQVRMRTDPTILIAAINGAAAGGGLGLALACDARIASPDAKLAAAFFKLGLSPDGGSTWLLPRLVGNQTARRFFFNDETWTGGEALEKGLVDEVVEQENLIDHAIKLAANWGKWSKMSRSGTKQLLDASTSTFFQTQLELEQALIIAASQTDEFAEGVAAFLEKREPTFD
ncbi:MAG: enoyl-CoA hydratase/isomerase family protein [Candidatus Thalassarchaeaceae archaeon]|jgi:2-(1,2-epoxy-1,2-dihydrophenyl)acetyl-CoA isomerase|nr:enoyl-CoA hydratase/isomerase family protein [Candidatus Thalassarchaeaceae archaeon]